MHVGRAQSVPSAARTRATRAPSLRTSAAALRGGGGPRTDAFVGERAGEAESGTRTCKAGRLLECDAHFGRVPPAMVAVEEERGLPEGG